MEQEPRPVDPSSPATAPAPAPPPDDAAPASADGAAGEQGYSDWRRRLRRNLSRPSDRRWDPLTHPIDRPTRG